MITSPLPLHGPRRALTCMYASGLVLFQEADTVEHECAFHTFGLSRNAITLQGLKGTHASIRLRVWTLLGRQAGMTRVLLA